MLQPPGGDATGNGARGSTATTSSSPQTPQPSPTEPANTHQPSAPSPDLRPRSTTPNAPAKQTKPTRRLWVSVLTRAAVVLVILIIAFSITGALIATKPQVGHTAVPELVRSVRVVELAEVPVARRWEGYGTVRPLNVSEVAAEVSGRVALRPQHIEPGVRIRAGELIVALDAADFASRLESAEQTIAALEAQVSSLEVQEHRTREQIDRSEDEIALAISEFERVRESVQQSAASQIEADRLEQSLARLRRELAGLTSILEQLPLRRAELNANIGAQRTSAETARRDLDRSRITSPIDGVVQRVDVRTGEFVQTGGVVARVVGLAKLEVPLRIPASAITTLRPGLAVTLRHVGPSAAIYEGVVARIAPEADASTRDITVFVEINQDPQHLYDRLAPAARDESADHTHPSEPTLGLLLPGHFVTGSVIAPERERRLVVPRKALNQDRLLVARVARANSSNSDNSEPALRAVAVNTRVLFYVDAKYPTLDPLETQWAVVQGGLEPGDRVIISNLDELTPGMRVEVREEINKPAATGRAQTPGGAN